MNTRDNHKPLTYKLQQNILSMKKSNLYSPIFILILIVISSLYPALSSLLSSNITIRSSGKIATILPLHTNGKYIKDANNNTVYLRGLWIGSFVDTSTGWWGTDAFKWNETALNLTLQQMRDVWHVNIVNVFIWGDWWLENKATSLSGTPTDIGCRDAIIRTIQVARDYGIYIQLRLYGCTRAEGRREGFPFQPTYSWTVQDFTDFWVNVTTTLKDYPNVVFHLFDEPSNPSGYTMYDWFNACNQTITAIRNAGVDHLIAVHWAYCGSMTWVADWVQGGYPTYNILFSEHIYRSLGTFGWNSNSPVDIESIRAYLNSTQGEPQGTATKYMMDTYNVPIWVSAIGVSSATDDNEYIAYVNTLAVLNEWNISYCHYPALRTQPNGNALQYPYEFPDRSEPSRMGYALINAILGIPPPPTHQITIESTPSSIQFTINGTARTTPYTGTLFEGTYAITMPPSITVYSHTPLFGNTATGAATGYYTYLYTAGPYTTDSSANVSAINLYTKSAGKARVAIYNATYYEKSPYPSDYPHPGNLIVESAEHTCQAETWNTISIPTVTLQPGTYFIAIKIDTNGMLSTTSKTWFGQYRTSNYAEPFPASFGTIEGGTGGEYSVYIPLAPFETSVYDFVRWEDNSTNPERTINLTTNMNLTAIYQPAT
jgi:hypothetical protein